MASRPTEVLQRSTMAGCDRCGKEWTSANAQAVAARHTDATGHVTWFETVLRMQYGSGSKETQPSLFE